MIVESTESHLISHLGWIDHGAVCLLDTATTQLRQVLLSDAKYLTLHPGKEDRFAAVHHFDSGRLEISAHQIATPEEASSRIVLSGSDIAFEGDMAVWESLPRAYVAYYRRLAGGEFLLFLVTSHPPAVEIQRFDWFDDSYDHDWQGIVGVTEVPGSDLVLVSVQRDSEPVLYDPRARSALRKIPLMGRGGNPTLRFRQTAPELWADDYDTLLRLNPRDWSVRDSLRLQDTGQPNLHLFIGNYGFNRDESLCVVARPHASDAVALSTETFQVTYRAALSQHPLDTALLSDGRVFARDWKTGDLLQGSLEPV